MSGLGRSHNFSNFALKTVGIVLLGYGEDESTWEPRQNLQCDALIEEWIATKKKKNAKKANAKSHSKKAGGDNNDTDDSDVQVTPKSQSERLSSPKQSDTDSDGSVKKTSKTKSKAKNLSPAKDAESDASDIVVKKTKAKTKQKDSKCRKRIKRSFESDSDVESENDEVKAPPPKKRASKKKVRKVSSDEEEMSEEEARPPKPLAPLDPKELIEVEEETEDEDGYKVTRKVKKCVDRNVSPSQIENVAAKAKETKKEPKTKTKSASKPATQKATAASKKAAAAVGQKSILSFFKPSNK